MKRHGGLSEGSDGFRWGGMHRQYEKRLRLRWRVEGVGGDEKCEWGGQRVEFLLIIGLDEVGYIC